MSLTTAQHQAITAQGNILLTAGAGTGKTRTLVERCLHCLTTGTDPASLQEILMVTFTEAAALEMRHRIRTRLETEAANDPANPRWQEQLALFDTAQIGTLHSFCLELVRQHFHTLSLDPQLAVMPPEEARLVSEEVLDRLLEMHYTGSSAESQAVRELVESRGRRGDQAIRGLVLKLHSFTQTLPDPENWLSAQQSGVDQPTPNDWETWLRQGFESWRQQWLETLSSSAHDHPVGRNCLEALAGVQTTSTRQQVTEALNALIQIYQNPPPRKKKAWIDPLSSFFKDAVFLHSLTRNDGDSDPLLEDWNWVRGRMGALLQLTRQFAEKFAEAKRDAGLVDFHDLEQHALTLLWDRRQGRPTEIACHWRTRLRHIFVDEYQDINAAQDLILTALSRDGSQANRFLVGDVKQSIYRFRLANPRIFQAYEIAWQQAGSHSIPLVENFRSHERLLQFVNSVFTVLMRPGIGGVAYDQRARLVFGAPDQRAALSTQASSGPCVEWHLRRRPRNSESDDAAEDNIEEDLSNLEESAKEARLVGLRLRQLVRENFQIQEVEGTRPATWRDMAVLLRSPNKKAEVYAREFSRLGIPLLVERPGFYQALEVRDLLNLLQILDNPQQDVPLLAVLRSPLCGLEVSELAEIRLAAKGLFWMALLRWRDLAKSAPAASPATRTRVTQFFQRYSRWRRLARQGSLARCLETVLAETRYDLWLETQPRGAQRALNVKRLLSLARRFGEFQRQGLYRFLRFIEAQQEAGAEPDAPPAAEQNAVRLLSIHQSKGLEFPIVALADLGKPFNLGDLKSEFILDDRYGLCPLVSPPGTRAHYPSLPYWLARRRQLEESLGDELRLLYVAFTRARNLLVLTATISEKKIQQCESALTEIPEASLIKARSYLDWLALWFAREIARPLSAGDHELLRWQLHEDSALTQIGAEAPPPTTIPEAPAAVKAPDPHALEKKLAWRYPYPEVTREPAKASVSTLRRRAVDSDENLAKPLGPGNRRWPELEPRKPAAASALEIGSALHAFMQHVHLPQATSLAALKQECARLVQAGHLTAEQGSLVNLNQAWRFFGSDIGQSIRAQAGCVRRELAFTCRVSLDELSTFLGQPILHQTPDFVVVQGAADLVVLLPDEIWLLDFKTDRIEARDLELRSAQYRPQLELYARALRGIYRRPVTRCWLYFLTLGKDVTIPIAK